MRKMQMLAQKCKCLIKMQKMQKFAEMQNAKCKMQNAKHANMKTCRP